MYRDREHIEYQKPWLVFPSVWSKKQPAPIWPVYSWEKEMCSKSLNQKLQQINGSQSPRPTRSGDKAAAAYAIVKTYTENTSLHGFKYITQDANILCERILWFLICAAALSGAVLFLMPYFARYLDTPIATTIESTAEPIWNIPFPAVTICNINKAKRDNVVNASGTSPWSNYSLSLIDKVIDLMANVGQVRLSSGNEFDENVRRIVNAHGGLIDDLMRKVIPPLDTMAVKCWWIGQRFNCSDLFEIRRTDEGYCWGFNSKPMKANASDSDTSGGEDAYDSRATEPAVQEPPSEATEGTRLETAAQQSAAGGTIPKHHDSGSSQFTWEDNGFVPKRVNGAGPNMGLTVLLNPEVDQYYSYSNFLHGFKVLVHFPGDFPSVGTQAFLVNSGKEVFVAVTATLTKSTDNVKKTNKIYRKCRYPDENKLKFYDSYSYANCFLECQVASMKKICGCVPYLYAALKGVELCNYTGTLCITSNSRRFSSITPRDGIPAGLDMKESMKNCKCQPSCEEVNYIPEISNANFPMFENDLEVPEGVVKKDLVLLRVFFKELTFVQYSRDLQYTANDLIAAFGGIVGLFIGFSFVSGAELVYFFTIRPALRWYQRATVPAVAPK